MTRREIVQLFTDMQLSFTSAYKRADERWKIPQNDYVIRIAVNYISPDGEAVTSSMLTGEIIHWHIGIKDLHFEERLYTPEEGIAFIQNVIYDLFERPYMYSWWKDQIHSKEYVTWSTAITIPEEPKPKFLKPTQQVHKPVNNLKRPKINRPNYAGRRNH